MFDISGRIWDLKVFIETVFMRYFSKMTSKLDKIVNEIVSAMPKATRASNNSPTISKMQYSNFLL